MSGERRFLMTIFQARLGLFGAEGTRGAHSRVRGTGVVRSFRVFGKGLCDQDLNSKLNPQAPT